MPTSLSPGRDWAVELHRSGQITEAMAAYRALLTQDPDNSDLLGLLGVATEQSGDLDEAERLLRLSLRDRTSVPLTFRNLNNLLGMMIESGRLEDAKTLAQEHLPGAWPLNRQPDDIEQETIISLISAFKDVGLAGEALAIGTPLLGLIRTDVDFILLMAELLHEAGQKDEAAKLLDRDFDVGEDLPNLHAARAALAHERGDFAACEQHSRRFAAAMPSLLAEANSSQQFVLAVLNKSPELIRDFRHPQQLHYSGNFPTQLAQSFSDRFRFLSILADAPTAVDALRGLPRPALALNNFANAEQLMVEDRLQLVSSLADSLGVKVINHPRLAVQATRQKNAARFASQPGIIFPDTQRYRSDKARQSELIADIEDRYGYPVIIRTVFQQMGIGTWLVEKRQELTEALNRLDGTQFYAIAYVLNRHRDGLFRSLRAAFVEGRSLIIRADYSETWNVRARRQLHQQGFYRKCPDLLQHANNIVRHPEAELGRGVLERLDRIAQLMPLEIFGMDFDVTDDGDVLIFETNATMNLLSTSPKELDYPAEAEGRLRTALEQYFTRLATQ
ncbi:tetratricopeptide repeat protein [Labrys sp. LIt4]|uniref:ATP-grasp domain-containing protein n=1 Tax=Labrys sp. LIt4 TaxID=2821355 RepID=UPI001ADFCE4B|nr:tetratricopeptide repeat protein [Labrys sp. LIt4]MBP0578609.1 tetratricopeptide repeat protein [Labrys sp. LIt4]